MKVRLSTNAVILAVFSIISKIFGALYRIPLMNIIGAEGMGMYQLIYSIYALILAFTTGGISISVAKTVAGNIDGKYSRQSVIKQSTHVVILSSLFLSILLIIFRKSIAIFQGNINIQNTYFLIIPTIFFVGIMMVFRGYFLGENNVKPSAISEIFESFFRLVFGLTFSILLIKRGVIFGVCGALLGLLISEFLALMYVIVTYLIYKKRDCLKCLNISENVEKSATIKTSFKYMLSGFIIPFSHFIDGIIIVNIINYTIFENATTIYGIYSGAVQSIVNMPLVLIASVSSALIPYISKTFAKRDALTILKFSDTATKIAVFLGVPLTILVFVFSREIISILYPVLSDELFDIAVLLLKVSSITILFNGLREIYGSILLSIGYINFTIENNILIVILKELTLVYIILKLGVLGIAITQIIFSISGMILNGSNVIFILGKNLKLVKNISKIMVTGAIMFLTAYFSNILFENVFIAIIIGGVLSSIIYLIFIVAFKVFEKDEISLLRS